MKRNITEIEKQKRNEKKETYYNFSSLRITSIYIHTYIVVIRECKVINYINNSYNILRISRNLQRFSLLKMRAIIHRATTTNYKETKNNNKIRDSNNSIISSKKETKKKRKQNSKNPRDKSPETSNKLLCMGQVPRVNINYYYVVILHLYIHISFTIVFCTYMSVYTRAYVHVYRVESVLCI